MPKPDDDVDFYQMLKLSPDASAGELETQIRTRLAQARRLVSHPEQGAKATQLIQQLRTARQVLLDPQRRLQYDARRRRPTVLPVLERWSKFARDNEWRLNDLGRHWQARTKFVRANAWRLNYLPHRWYADARRQIKSLGLRLGSFVGRLTGKT